MAKTDALSIYISDDTTKDKLMETYSEVIDMVQTSTVSTSIKNQNLSGDPQAGSVEARRLATSVSQAYGTARAAGAGDKISNNGVTINLSTDKEIVEEFEMKDIELYGIPSLLEKRKVNQAKAMARELDRAFFTEAVAEGTSVDLSAYTAIEDSLEALIQSVETVSNDNVDGVDRDMIVLTVTPAVYARLAGYIESVPNPIDGMANMETFHKVRVFVTHRQTVDAICMVEGAVAQPVVVKPYEAEKIPLSNAYAVSLFYSFGTQAVMKDLIKYGEITNFVSA